MSNLNRQQLSDNQKKAQQYLKDHRIEELLGDILNTIAHNRYDQPLVYMIKYLAKQLPNEILVQNGIAIENKEEVDSIMQIQYPQFEQSCNSIFRQSLSREVYQQCKNLQTVHKNNMRHLIQLALENQKHKVGLFASDPSCYTTFKPIFSFVQNAVFTKIYPLPEDFEYERELDYPKSTSLNQEFKYFEEFNIKIKRNIQDYQFNSAMKSTEREQVKQNINECLQTKLKKLFTQHFNLEDLQSDDRTNLAVQYNKLIKESNALVRNGNRYREWPESRSIAISSNKKYLVQVNKEDHFELKCTGTKELNFLEYLIQSIQITQLLDKHLGFNFDKKEGYTTVKPIYQGLALKFKIKVKIPSSHQTAFKNNIENLKKNPSSYFDIKSIKKDSARWLIILNKTYGLTWKQLFQQIESYLKTLFQSITDKNNKPIDINIIDLEQYAKTDNDVTDQEEEEEEEEEEDDEQQQNAEENEENQKDAILEENGVHQNEESEDSNEQNNKEEEATTATNKVEINTSNKNGLPKEESNNNNKSTKMNNSDHSSKSTDESVNLQNEVDEINILKEEQTSQKANSNCKNAHQKGQTVTYIKKSDLVNQANQSNANVNGNINNNNQTQNQNGNEITKKTQQDQQEQQAPQQQQTISVANNEPAKLDHVEITIEENSDQEEKKSQIELNDIELLPYDFDRITKYKRVERASNYSELQVEISKFILKKNFSELPTGEYDLQKIIASCEPSVILQSYNQPHEFIKDSFFIFRRNFKSLPLKSKMNEEDFAKSDAIIQSFIQQIETQPQYKGERFYAKDAIYESKIQECLKEYPLFEDRETFNLLKTFDNNRFSYGSFYFRNKNLKIIGNLDDHLIIILTINYDDIIENLIELNRIYSKLNEPVYKDEKLGYVTRNPCLCGSGLSIIYKINEINRSNSFGLTIVQTDENSNIITKFLEKENYVHIELNRVDNFNLHQFTQDCNNHLVQMKISDSTNQLLTENQLTMMDCFDQDGRVIAPEKECYTYYKEVYETYLKKFNLNETPLGLYQNPVLSKFIEIQDDIRVTYEIKRNFEQFNFTKYMTFKEVEELKQYFEKIFGKIQNFHLKDKEDSHSYKTQIYTHSFKYFQVELMKTDHVGILSFGKLKELQKSLTETFELLSKFQSEKYTYLRDENLGYLSEVGQRLGDNFYLKLELTVNPEELEQIQKLAKQHQYNLTITKDSSLYKSNSYNNNIVLELKRCGYFLYEMEFITRLIYIFAEKKESKKQ